MPLTAKDIAEIERSHAAGLSSRQIIEVLEAHGEHLTEATLRKYVQLGLLPRSRRVGEKGKHRGSRGIYPVEVVRRIDEIRRAMTSGETLESLARATQAVRAKLASARASVLEVIEAAEVDLAGRDLDRAKRSSLRTEFSSLSRQATAWLRSMERWTVTLQRAEHDGARSKAARNGAADRRSPADRRNQSDRGDRSNPAEPSRQGRAARRPGGI